MAEAVKRGQNRSWYVDELVSYYFFVISIPFGIANFEKGVDTVPRLRGRDDIELIEWIRRCNRGDQRRL